MAKKKVKSSKKTDEKMSIDKKNSKGKSSSKKTIFCPFTKLFPKSKLSKSICNLQVKYPFLNKAMPILKKVSFALLISVGLYLVLMPFIPQLAYYFKQLTGKVVYEAHITDHDPTDKGRLEDDADDTEIPEDNRVVIPVIGIDSPIVEGSTNEVLNKGAWHRPGTGNPEDGGNMVITGHRFRYLPPNNLTFYHLDKVAEGDRIIVYWKKVKYDYEVTDTFVVEPTRTDIEEKTVNSMLTLYTCTPLWTADKRLVVIAEPVVNEGTDDRPEEVELEDI